MDAQATVGELSEKAREKSLAQRFWRTARGFWTGEQRRVAWLMTGGLLALVLVQLWFSYRLNVWNRQVFDALEKKDGAAVLSQAYVFLPLAFGSIVAAVLIVYARMR